MIDRANQAGSADTILSDPRRLAALARTGLFPDVPLPSTDGVLDRFTSLAARLLHAPVSCVTLISDQEQLFAGLAGVPKLPDRRALDNGWCQQVVVAGKPLIVGDVAADSVLRTNSMVIDYGIVAYCGVPLIVDGQTLGALCAIDSKVREWTRADVTTLSELAELVQREIQLRILEREEALIPHRFEALLNAIPAGIYACDADGRLVFYNEHAAVLWGSHPPLGSREAAAFASRNITGSDGGPVLAADTPLSLALRGVVPPQPVEVTLGEAAEAVVALASAEPLVSPGGALAGAVGVLQDVTALRQASRLRNELLAFVSHELRTPLTVIVGVASFLERHGSDERSRAEATQMLVSASRRMERVVENMLQLSHLEHDRADAEPVLAQMILTDALTRFGRDFPGAEAHRIDGDRSIVVSAVQSWSALALVNLLQNAHLYGDGSEPTLVQLVLHKNELQFRVSNPGETFTDEQYEALFEPFVRRPSTRSKTPGAGLGLTTARKLAEAQGGRLLAGPRPDGQGSMFTFALPAYQQQR